MIIPPSDHSSATIRASIQTLLLRDLTKLETELGLYPTEESIWIIDKSIKNSAGNLALHLCGNLQTYVGKILGNISYVRDREHEFAAKNIPLATLLKEINKTKIAIEKTLPMLNSQVLNSNYPEDVFGYPMATLHFLIHLTAHLGYHLGQVNYHRRLLAS